MQNWWFNEQIAVSDKEGKQAVFIARQNGNCGEILGNYEYAEDGLVFVNDILKHSNEEKENFNKDLTRCTLGCLMKELFSEQVRLVQRGPKGSCSCVYNYIVKTLMCWTLFATSSACQVIEQSGWLLNVEKNKREQKPGWNTEIVEWCKQAAEDKNLKDCDYWGGFVIDEMKVEENLEMVVKGGKHRLVGYVDLSPLHDDMRALEVIIYWTILDGADVNRKFIQMHFPDYEPVEKKFVAFNMHTGGPMVFMVDCKHNFKKIRNNIEKSNEAGKPRCLTVAGKRILWKHLIDAYKFDQTLKAIHIHEKLTEEHFQLDPALRMRNHLAEDVLDNRMHFLIKAYQRHLTNNGKDGSALDATIQMIDHTSSVIEFFSTSREADMSKDDSRLRNLDGFIQFFSDWKEEATPKQFISSKLLFDLQSMVHGFKSVVNIKLTKFPNSVIRQWLVNQDGVENHFCQTRSCNGSNNNPTYRLQESSQNTIRFGQEGISSKCNAGISRA
ncbi:unnamed protein product [Porites evermanni]|uniref:Uncharacterized protein n=1 Tax=Porites evermanni TaxID=104178 RepID=A0ABN8LCJ9_9CNID|nr:unnamed protein product [Porites evermanni]